ncbi:DegT/DnrJ/EryC1/StrS family aminotransferase [Variovorax robiniae]|uniref:DegT/DnrJ/EryC1/StrS family aminotransferase n=1 Tax=Variovorax robiniae TaxID=1836199 RepID=A0ABU8XET4_9BURK
MNAVQFASMCVPISLPWMDALATMDSVGSGILLAVDESGRLMRTVTDGDLRRAVLQQIPRTTNLAGLPGRPPVVATESSSLAEIQRLMELNCVLHVPVLDTQGRPVDVITGLEASNRIWLSSPHLGDQETSFVDDAFKTNWIAPLGPHVDGFEREVAAHVGVQHAAALSSGTAALHLGLLLLGVKAGDTVFCSTLTFVASCNPIVYCGAQPVFIDSEPSTWNMSPQALERALHWARRRGQLPRCVVLVNLYGQSAEMDALLPICSHYGVPVLEDAAESLGAKYRGQSSGTFGRLGVFSFNGNKIITTSGGGMLVSDDGDLIGRAQKLSTQARDTARHYEHSELGFNYRLSNVLAGIGRGQLRVLDQRVQQRRLVFERYRQGLADFSFVEWMPEPEHHYSTRWLSCLTLDLPDADAACLSVMRTLERHSIEARPVWKPMHMQPLFASAPYFGHAEGEDVSRRLFLSGLCLPSGSNMDTHQQDRVINLLRRSLSQWGTSRAAV